CATADVGDDAPHRGRVRRLRPGHTRSREGHAEKGNGPQMVLDGTHCPSDAVWRPRALFLTRSSALRCELYAARFARRRELSDAHSADASSAQVHIAELDRAERTRVPSFG